MFTQETEECLLFAILDCVFENRAEFPGNLFKETNVILLLLGVKIFSFFCAYFRRLVSVCAAITVLRAESVFCFEFNLESSRGQRSLLYSIHFLATYPAMKLKEFSHSLNIYNALL